MMSYAADLTGVTELPAGPSHIGRARVETHGDTAVSHPGTRARSVARRAATPPGSGATALPAGAREVAVDLRDLPAVDGLGDILAADLAPALAQPVPRRARIARKHHGHTDG